MRAPGALIVAAALLTACPGPSTPDAGTGGGAATGGGTGGSGGSAGAGGGTSGAGGGSGGGTAGAGGGSAGGTTIYDGGPSCPNSTRPRLMCDPPRTLVSGGGAYSFPSLATLGGSLLAAWSDDGGVALHELPGDGGNALVMREAIGLPLAVLALSSEGRAWGMAWDTGPDTPIRCMSSFDSQPRTSGQAGIDRSGVAVAVAEDGGVALALGDDSYLYWAISGAGCPSALGYSGPGNRPESDPGAIHVPGTGFRFTSNGTIDATHAIATVWAPVSDGGLDDSWNTVSMPLFGQTLELTGSGFDILQIYSSIDADNYGLIAVRSVPVDLGPVQLNDKVVAQSDGWFDATTCGSNCLGIAMTTDLAFDQTPKQVEVLFTTRDTATHSLTASDAGWDAVCSTPAFDTAMAVELHQGRLQVLVALPDSVQLYSCTIPPL